MERHHITWTMRRTGLDSDHDTHRRTHTGTLRVSQLTQRLPIISAADTQHENIHGTFTAGAQSPQQIIGSAHVIGDATRFTSLDHTRRTLAQIAFEATTGKQPGIFAIGRNQQQSTGLAVSGPCGMQVDGQRHIAPGLLLAGKQGQQRGEKGLHARSIASSQADGQCALRPESILAMP